jgi:hypothetical protein
MSPRYSLRRYARRDGNEKALVATIKACGASWLPIAVRDGPDGIVGWHGKNYLVEVKTPKGDHKAGQERFAETWQGTIHVLRTSDDVCKLLGVDPMTLSA